MRELKLKIQKLGVRPPAKCQLCHEPIVDVFIDGATKTGQWAYMCTACHLIHGYGLGIGRGQRYVRKADQQWVKTSK